MAAGNHFSSAFGSVSDWSIGIKRFSESKAVKALHVEMNN
jgi:hypothetical protein